MCPNWIIENGGSARRQCIYVLDHVACAVLSTQALFGSVLRPAAHERERPTYGNRAVLLLQTAAIVGVTWTCRRQQWSVFGSMLTYRHQQLLSLHHVAGCVQPVKIYAGWHLSEVAICPVNVR